MLAADNSTPAPADGGLPVATTSPVEVKPAEGLMIGICLRADGAKETPLLARSRQRPVGSLFSANAGGPARVDVQTARLVTNIRQVGGSLAPPFLAMELGKDYEQAAESTLVPAKSS